MNAGQEQTLARFALVVGVVMFAALALFAAGIVMAPT